MVKLLFIILMVFIGFKYFHTPDSIPQHSVQNNTPPAITVQNTTHTSDSDAIIANAFATHKSNLQISGQGSVVKLLPDDNVGSKHQKFILKLASGQTLLVAHNIDLAPKIFSIQEGDSIQFNGEYEWNEKGGILHWTHQDPKKLHMNGWLKHKGQTYQ